MDLDGVGKMDLDGVGEMDLDDVGLNPLDYITAAAKKAEKKLVPQKSGEKYQKAYAEFIAWRDKHGGVGITETILLGYLQELSERMKASSLWAYYSMIKSIAKLNDNIDCAKFYKVTAFLKNNLANYVPVRANVYTTGQIAYFFGNAEDSEWLDVNVVFIFRLCGGLRTDELTRIKVNDIEKHGDLMLVNTWETKTKQSKSFTICGALCDPVNKYAALRCPLMVDPRFFINYRGGKCTNQVIGKHKFAKMPERVARYLQLPNPLNYTGHTLRRSSATFLANSGATIDRVMRHGRWSSMKIAEMYVDASLQYKRETGEMIAASWSSKGGTSSSTSTVTSNSIGASTSNGTSSSTSTVISNSIGASTSNGTSSPTSTVTSTSNGTSSATFHRSIDVQCKINIKCIVTFDGIARIHGKY